jgi:cytoskeletal protein RodZ
VRLLGDMPTLGEELKRRREKRGITLNEISESTRIGTRFLKAIETDQYSILPGGIFTRSFIRAYARQVGMDEDEALQLYHRHIDPQYSETQSEQPGETPQPPSHVEVRQPTTRGVWASIVIVAGLLLFAAIIAFALFKALDRQVSGGAPQEAGGPPGKPEPQASATPTPAVKTGQPDQPTGVQPSSDRPPQSVATTEPLVVRLEATTESSAIQYWIDGARTGTSLLLKEGENKELPPAQSEIKLSIGNRPVLKIKINNRDADFPPDTAPWGAKVTITRDNLQTFLR